MSRYPPLTVKELQAIQEANKGNPDVRRLLWEIHRLHQVLFRFDISMHRLTGDQSYLAMEATATCFPLLDAEPAVRRRRALEKKAREGDRGVLDHYNRYNVKANPQPSPDGGPGTPRT